MSDKLFERVQSLIVYQLGVDAVQVIPESAFEDDLGADSLDQVELAMALEEEFCVEIPDGEASQLRTVRQVVDWLRAHGCGKE